MPVNTYYNAASNLHSILVNNYSKLTNKQLFAIYIKA